MYYRGQFQAINIYWQMCSIDFQKLSYLLVAFVFICSLCPSFVYGQWISDGAYITQEEQRLYQLVNAYRNEHGLPSIPLSRSLTAVAQTHVRDLQEHFQYGGRCNMHSWSNCGIWSACCYTPDHAQAQHMWNKPSQLTPYKDYGFENAYMCSGGADAEGSLEGWKHSSGHNAVILNLGKWNDTHWKSLGIAIYKNYAVLWFGKEPDPVRDKPLIVLTQAEIYGRVSHKMLDSIASHSTLQPYHTSSPSRSNVQLPSRASSTQRRSTTYRDRFYGTCGKSHLTLLSCQVGWGTYSGGIVGFGTLGFRVRLFKANLLDFEMLLPYDNEVGFTGERYLAYHPTIGADIPIGYEWSINLYLGISATFKAIRETLDGSYDTNSLDQNGMYNWFFGKEHIGCFSNYRYAMAGMSINGCNFFSIYVEDRMNLSNNINANSGEFVFGIRISLGCSFR